MTIAAFTTTEIGQGTRTMHAQIVADTLGLPYDCIDVNAADTAAVPDSGPTVRIAAPDRGRAADGATATASA